MPQIPVHYYDCPSCSTCWKFGQRLLPDLRFVLCVRNPLDVAASLQKRDGMTLDAAADLWLAYVAASFAHTAGTPRLVVWYDDLIAGAADVVDSAHGGCLRRCFQYSARHHSERSSGSVRPLVIQRAA